MNAALDSWGTNDMEADGVMTGANLVPSPQFTRASSSKKLLEPLPPLNRKTVRFGLEPSNSDERIQQEFMRAMPAQHRQSGRIHTGHMSLGTVGKVAKFMQKLKAGHPGPAADQSGSVEALVND